jgi:predicted O-methyltransferase YrrM
VADIYRNASSGRVWGRFLGTLTRELAPLRVLELGTNLGLSAAHLAAGLAASGRPDARIVTLEGARALARLAATHLDALGVGTGPGAPVEIVVGPFAETLGEVCRAHGPFDLVFVDGHHEEQATLDYIDALRPFLAPGAVVVLDDVEPGRAVWRAWRRLRAAEPHRDAVYLGRMGLLTLGDPAGVTADAAVRLGSTDPQPLVAAYEALPPERSRMRDPSL